MTPGKWGRALQAAAGQLLHGPALRCAPSAASPPPSPHPPARTQIMHCVGEQPAACVLLVAAAGGVRARMTCKLALFRRTLVKGPLRETRLVFITHLQLASLSTQHKAMQRKARQALSCEQLRRGHTPQQAASTAWRMRLYRGCAMLSRRPLVSSALMGWPCLSSRGRLMVTFCTLDSFTCHPQRCLSHVWDVHTRSSQCAEHCCSHRARPVVHCSQAAMGSQSCRTQLGQGSTLADSARALSRPSMRGVLHLMPCIHQAWAQLIATQALGRQRQLACVQEQLQAAHMKLPSAWHVGALQA